MEKFTLHTSNVENVQLSEKTRMIIRCKAMLNDIRGTLYCLYADEYDNSDLGDNIAVETLAAYDNIEDQLHREIDKLMIDSITSNLCDSECKQI